MTTPAPGGPQPSAVHQLAAERAAADLTGQSTAADHLSGVARDVHALARGALDAVEAVLAELAASLAQVSDPAALAGEGNLGWFSYQATAQVAALRGCLAAYQADRDALAGFLATAGIQVPAPGQPGQPQ